MEELTKKIRKHGFKNMNDFVKANLHYLPENKQKLFNLLQDNHIEKYNTHKYYSKRSYYAKN